MASTDAKHIPVKNTAYRVTFPIFDADGDLVTGATGLDSEVSIDAGTFADCTNEATEIATASGMYYLDLTSSEMNGDTIAIIVKTSSSGAKTTPLVLYPAARNINDLAFPTTTGRSIDVTATGGVGIDWANVENPTTTLNLSGTTVKTATDVETDTADIQTRLPAALVGGKMDSDMTAISGDATASDNLETMLDGTGGQTLSLGHLTVSGSGDAVTFTSTGSNGRGLLVQGNGTGNGATVSSGLTSGSGMLVTGVSVGLHLLGQYGMFSASSTPNGSGMAVTGNGTGHGIEALGGATGNGIQATGGSSSGSGLMAEAQAGNNPGIIAQGNGTGAGLFAGGGASGSGLVGQSGASGTAGIEGIGVGAGVDIFGDLTGDITGSLSGTVGGIAGTLQTLDALWVKLKKWLQLGFRKDAAIATDNATELGEINANGGSGAGAYDNTTDSQQAIADSSATPPTAAVIADAVWDEARAGHVSAGSFGEYVPAALANVAHGGIASVLTLERVVVASTTANQPAVKLTGNGSGQGLLATGGASGEGAKMLSGGNNHGLSVVGVGGGNGLNIAGGATGNGLQAIGGATSGAGIRAQASGGNDNGLDLVGNGSGAGLQALGGATGDGVRAYGGATSGDGIHGEAVASGHGMNVIGAGSIKNGLNAVGSPSSDGNGIYAVGDGSGHGIAGIGGALAHGLYGEGGASAGNGAYLKGGPASAGLYARGGATSGAGIQAVAFAGNSNGITSTGLGSGHGLAVTGGATGNGLHALGGATSGDGLHAEAQTQGDGIEGVGAGTGEDIVGTLADLSTVTVGEPSGAPGATLTLKQKIGYLFMVLRNKITVTASAKTLYDDAGVAVWSKTLSDDGTTYTEGEGA